MAKAETQHIDKAELLAFLQREVAADLASLSFIPSWEGSCYIATREGGQRLLVKAFDHEWRPPNLEETLAAARFLYASCGLEEIVPPRRLANGSFVAEFGGYGVAVFAFVEGASLANEPVTEQATREIARFVAALHAPSTRRAVKASGIAVRTLRFALGFEEVRGDVVDAAARLRAEGARGEAARLIHSGRADIAWLLDRVRGKIETPASPVLTHGDLNAGNFIRQPDGRLRVIDWTKLAIAPRELDLLSFADRDFPQFLAAYLEHSEGVRLHAAYFAYFMWRGALAEIVDFGSLLLLEDATPQDRAFALAQLKSLLPLDRKGFDARLSLIVRCVQEAGG